ncbi:hypothetical protein BC940DRAFT_335815 [Gongronella butleri]|nr:hypothetical protein BC940DRAFT_335815 [Gongronella butleri]
MKDATGRSVSLLNEPSTGSTPSAPIPAPILVTHPTTTYSSKRKYHCIEPGCNKSFTTSGHLARHHRIHTGEKNFPCLYPGCPSRFSRQDNMMQHYRTHLSPKSRRPQGASSVSTGRVAKSYLPPRLHCHTRLTSNERSMVYSLMESATATPALEPMPLTMPIPSGPRGFIATSASPSPCNNATPSRMMLPPGSLPPPAPLEPTSPMISPTLPTDPHHHHVHAPHHHPLHRRPQRTHSSSSSNSSVSSFLSPRLSMSPPPLEPCEVLYPKPMITPHFPIHGSRRHPLDLAHIVSTIG